jgi:hypothetical protein
MLHHEDVWGSGCIGQRFLDLGTSCTWVISFTPLTHWPRRKILRYPFERKLGRPQNRADKPYASGIRSVKLNRKISYTSCSIANRLRARQQRTEVRFSSRTRNISVPHSVNTGYVAHAVSCSGVQLARFCRWSRRVVNLSSRLRLIPRSRIRRLVPPFPLRLYSVVLN